MSDIFLNYRRTDGWAAESVLQHLEKAGFEIFIDNHIQPGIDFERAIDQALGSARVVLAVLGSGGLSWKNRLKLLLRPTD
jgi:hypothetical protein